MDDLNIRIINSILMFYDAHSEDVKFENNCIKGKAIFNDRSGIQDFVWNTPNFKHPTLVDFILSFLINNRLHLGDKIVIPLDNLISEVVNLNYTQNDVKNAIDEIQDIQIFMVDNGEKTDYFFVHF